MIKITLATLISAGVIGTGAHTFTPQSLNVTAGAVVFEAGNQGLKVDVAPTPDFAVSLTTKGDRTFTVRF